MSPLVTACPHPAGDPLAAPGPICPHPGLWVSLSVPKGSPPVVGGAGEGEICPSGPGGWMSLLVPRVPGSGGGGVGVDSLPL